MMTALNYYGLSFNPFDKQQVKEKDRFLSQDLQEMLNRLDYLKDTRGIGVFTAGPGMGKSFALRKPVHEALRQRITVHYTFSGLSDAEVADYVRHKLVCAGGAETIIEPAALSALHSHSQGNPRVVDNLVSDALLLGAQMDKKAIDPDTTLAAVSGRNLV